ncbi:MAG: hypothetical protein Q9216_000261 [Gyalolechia sp. 2 TL-2023]
MAECECSREGAKTISSGVTEWVLKKVESSTVPTRYLDFIGYLTLASTQSRVKVDHPSICDQFGCHFRLSETVFAMIITNQRSFCTTNDVVSRAVPLPNFLLDSQSVFSSAIQLHRWSVIGAVDYLAYVTNDAENIQFYLWLVDYHQRFRNAPSEETALSPKWNFDDPQSSPRSSGNSGDSVVGVSDKTLSVLGVKDFNTIAEEDISNVSVFEDYLSPYTTTLGTLKFSEVPLADYKPPEGSKRRSTDAQPFRKEINRVVAHYIIPGSPRELKLSPKDRAAVLYALRRTTHPSAFNPIKKALDMTLRNQSHPNFVRWSICNGNRPWTIFLRTFAVCNIVVGFAIAIILTLSSASRWYRILAALEWWFGITNLIAAYQGLCVLLLRRHTREIRPWEMNEQGRKYGSNDEEAALRHSKVLYEETKSRWPVKMELFGPSNTTGNETWMDRYSMRSVFKKTFEKEVPTHDRGLHTIQNKIVRQAEAWALIITIPLTIIFTALPKGNLY